MKQLICNYTFVLDTGAGGLLVSEFLRPPCREGSHVIVSGVFHQVEQRDGYTFYNQLDAEQVSCR